MLMRNDALGGPWLQCQLIMYSMTAFSQQGGFSRSLMQLVLFDPHLVLALHSGGVISRIGPCRIAASHAGLGFRA
jgi:hypothetical protein